MRWAAMGLVLGLLGCGEALPVSGFRETAPVIDPIRFFTGHVSSWGVLEDRAGQPTRIVKTDCTGDMHDGTLRLTQLLFIGEDAPVTRTWQMRRTAPGRYGATANDMVGNATGEANGRAFHWTWTLATSPGNPLKNVHMDQWWYLLDDGSMLNRTTIRKLGVIVAEVSEHFARMP